MAGNAEYQDVAFGAGNQSWAPGRRLSDAADMLGYSSIEQKLRELLGTQQAPNTAVEAMPMATPSPTPETQAAGASPEDVEWVKQYLSRTPTPAPTATPTTSQRLMGMLGVGGR